MIKVKVRTDLQQGNSEEANGGVMVAGQGE
jgi:hypothetical protein